MIFFLDLIHWSLKEELFSVFQGTTPVEEQKTVGVKKYPDETQEHLEVCQVTKNERR